MARKSLMVPCMDCGGPAYYPPRCSNCRKLLRQQTSEVDIEYGRALERAKLERQRRDNGEPPF